MSKLKITIETPEGHREEYTVDRAVFVLSNDVGEKAAEITGGQYPPGNAEELLKAVRFIADNMTADEKPEVKYIGGAINTSIDEVLSKLTELQSIIEAGKVNEDLLTKFKRGGGD